MGIVVVCPNIFRGHPIIDHFLFEGPSIYYTYSCSGSSWTLALLCWPSLYDYSVPSWRSVRWKPLIFYYLQRLFSSTKSNKGRQSLQLLSHCCCCCWKVKERSSNTQKTLEIYASQKAFEAFIQIKNWFPRSLYYSRVTWIPLPSLTSWAWN